MTGDESVLPIKCINRSRIILAVSLGCFITGSIIYFVVVDKKLDYEGRLEFVNDAWMYYIPPLQAVACALLTTSIGVLLVKLQKFGKF